MGIIKPESGEVITPLSIEDMYLRPQKKVNISNVDYMQDATLGPQHLPSIHHMSDSKSFHAPNVTITKAHSMEYETISDIISGNWADVMNLDNAGAGYILPPCKVLVMFDADLKHINKNATGGPSTPSSANQAWFAVYHTESSGGVNTHVLGAGAVGMVSAYNPEPVYSFHLGQLVREQISIWFVIDKTALTADWTLSNLQVRAACGWGATSSAYLNETPESIEIANGSLSFCALMRDAT